MESKAYYLAQAEKQRKLAVWARRARKPVAQAKHEKDCAYFLACAEETEN